MLLLETYNNPWDFQLLDSGNGYRLEQWGQALLARPDPQIIWQASLPKNEWDKVTAQYFPAGQSKGESFAKAKDSPLGKWQTHKPLPKPWLLKWNNISFLLKLSPFKHTGIFAEQAAQWDWLLNRLEIKDGRLKTEKKISNPKSKILNLFGYTGAATIVLAKAGCFVTHVDASKPSITWANENAKLNKLPKDSIRWILEDAVKFVEREIKRGQTYDGIILDPPAFGHSPTGKTWKFAKDVPSLLTNCVKLLSPNAKFLILNAYATNSSALAIKNLMEDATANLPGNIEFGELCLKQKNQRLLSTGIFARWSK